MLTRPGYQVFCARNGRDALQALSEQKFDLLFSDVVMPNGISGVELAYEASRLDKELKVLLTSGLFGDKLQLQANEFSTIDKPYRHSDLARRLRSSQRRQDRHLGRTDQVVAWPTTQPFTIG
jgi:DNA-binding response OmpR family regulator